MNITWLGQAGLLFDVNGKTIMVPVELNNYDILTILEKNQLWKLVPKKVTVYRSQDDALTVKIYPNLPK